MLLLYLTVCQTSSDKDSLSFTKRMQVTFSAKTTDDEKCRPAIPKKSRLRFIVETLTSARRWWRRRRIHFVFFFSFQFRFASSLSWPSSLHRQIEPQKQKQDLLPSSRNYAKSSSSIATHGSGRVWNEVQQPQRDCYPGKNGPREMKLVLQPPPKK